MSLTGMDRTTGAPLSAADHIAQSVADILTTPIGSRVMLRDYGSALFDILDRPLNAATRLQLFAATATAIARWEPRLTIKRLSLDGDPASGTVALSILGEAAETGTLAFSVNLSKGA